MTDGAVQVQHDVAAEGEVGRQTRAGTHDAALAEAHGVGIEGHVRVDQGGPAGDLAGPRGDLDPAVGAFADAGDAPRLRRAGRRGGAEHRDAVEQGSERVGPAPEERLDPPDVAARATDFSGQREDLAREAARADDHERTTDGRTIFL